MIKKYLPFVSLILVMFALRLPSFFEPHWYFDEGVYSLFGKAIVEGETPYQYIWDHKPLGIYLIYSLTYLMPFDILIGAKLLAFASAATSLMLLYLLARQAFSQKIALTAAFLFAILSSLPFFDGNQANGEIFLITPVLLGLYLIEPFNKKADLKKLFFAGLAIGTAVSIKQTAACRSGSRGTSFTFERRLAHKKPSCPFVRVCDYPNLNCNTDLIAWSFNPKYLVFRD